MSRDERERLGDIKDAILAIRRHLQDAEAESTENDSLLLRDALLFQFVVIGEAVKHLAAKTRALVPDIPWADIAGLRDLIAHEYFRIEIARILEIVDHNLPALERQSAGCSASKGPSWIARRGILKESARLGSERKR